jgi:hypothetical protein
LPWRDASRARRTAHWHREAIASSSSHRRKSRRACRQESAEPVACSAHRPAQRARRRRPDWSSVQGATSAAVWPRWPAAVRPVVATRSPDLRRWTPRPSRPPPPRPDLRTACLGHGPADAPRGDYSNRHTARFITITDTTMEVEGDVMRTQVACRKPTGA